MKYNRLKPILFTLALVLLLSVSVLPGRAAAAEDKSTADICFYYGEALGKHYSYTDGKTEYQTAFLISPTEDLRNFRLYKVIGIEANGSSVVFLVDMLESWNLLDQPLQVSLYSACGAIPEYAVSYQDRAGNFHSFTINEDMSGEAKKPVDFCAAALCTPTYDYQHNLTDFPWTPFTVHMAEGTPYYRDPVYDSGTAGRAEKGIYTIVEVIGGWGRLKSGAGWVDLSDSRNVTVAENSSASTASYPAVPFLVQVSTSAPYYNAPDSSSFLNGWAQEGVYTITEVQGDWGHLKSGAGWLYLANSTSITVLGPA